MAHCFQVNKKTGSTQKCSRFVRPWQLHIHAGPINPWQPAQFLPKNQGCLRPILQKASAPPKTACGRHVACYFANALQHEGCQISRRTRQRLYLAAGVLSLAVWLFMAAAELWTPLHAWLHGGTIPDDDDDCAIVAIAHGKIETAPCDVPPAVPVTWIEVPLSIEFSAVSTAIPLLPDGRAPPAFSAVS
jgi:hypothetical protein